MPLWRAGEDNGHREFLGLVMAPPGDTGAVWDPTNTSSHPMTSPGGALRELLGSPLGDLCLQGGQAKQRGGSEILPSGRRWKSCFLPGAWVCPLLSQLPAGSGPSAAMPWHLTSLQP